MWIFFIVFCIKILWSTLTTILHTRTQLQTGISLRIVVFLNTGAVEEKSTKSSSRNSVDVVSLPAREVDINNQLVKPNNRPLRLSVLDKLNNAQVGQFG